MPTARITYDPELRQTDHGRRLYSLWKRLRKSAYTQDFEQYPDFFKWAMASGYTIGAKLFRYNAEEPFSPGNCFWGHRVDQTVMEKELRRKPDWEKSWDATVNRIRVHYGMEPIHSSEV